MLAGLTVGFGGGLAVAAACYGDFTISMLLVSFVVVFSSGVACSIKPIVQ